MKNIHRERGAPIVLEWQRGLIAYTLGHAQGAGELLFKRSASDWRGA